MFSIKDTKSAKLEKALSEQLQNELNQNEINEDELFVLADYDASAGEKSGYSNYSYWQSTIRVFLKNKVAVFLLCVLVALLLFTVVQPYLPGQYPANLINNHPQSGKQLSNLAPSFSTVLMTAPEGTILNSKEVKGYEGWYAVDNVLASLKARTNFTVVEYGDEWCKIEYDGKIGFVKNNFQTKLKLPDDPTAVPYESKSNFQLNMFMQPEDYTNDGTALYVAASSIKDNGDGTATTVSAAELCVLPSDHAFWFGTNNIGEFLAIVHGLALLKQKGIDIPIYSDSHNALLWVAQKKCKTKLPRDARSEELFGYIERAEKWLKNNSYTTRLIKWETAQWGEIPADFGRK